MTKDVLMVRNCDWDFSWEDRVRITKEGFPSLEVEISELSMIEREGYVVMYPVAVGVFIEINMEDAKSMLESYYENWRMEI
jgi:hypothetical protein